MAEKKGLSLDGAKLKWIAMASMLVDHIGAVLVPESSALYTFMRLVGRLAFPLYCFLIAEGFHYTRNAYRYGAGMILFALISEVPFDLAIFGRIWAPEYQNVFFTLAIGIFAVLYYDKLTAQGRPALAVGAVLLALFLAYFLSCDYGPEGVLLIFLFYILRYKELYRNLAVIVWCVLMGAAEAAGALSLLFINVYNGERGRVKFKYFFYAFYPAHLLALGLMKAAGL